MGNNPDDVSFSSRVSQSVATRMDVSNLSRVLGPTLVGHAVPNPEPMTMLQDTKRQPKVGGPRGPPETVAAPPCRVARFLHGGEPTSALSLPGGGAAAGLAPGVLESVPDGGERAARPHDHREHQLLLHAGN